MIAQSGRRQRSTGRAAARAKTRGGFLLGLFLGLFAGLAIALAVAFYVTKTPIPFVGKATKPAAKDEPLKPPAIAGMPQADTKAEKPKFDFYRILPGAEEPVTERELKEAARGAKAEPPKGEAPRAIYFIQAGSFQNPADADNQKAKLALLGLEAGVEPTTLPDKGTWYRVRLGPYARIDDLNRVRQLLAQNGIDASLVKIKDPAKDGQ
ncbi:MAG: SPOR domain-containing protein [Burkholderiales bacterium]|nr:SPOR domain-containing protein [Burkholderiales bacterium]